MRIAKRASQLRALKSGAYKDLEYALKRGSAPTSTEQYERALSRLGMTLLQEQTADLIPYLVGFQLLDKSDEGNFAAGFFIFDIGGMLIDTPIFLVDGKVKGYQMLFLREQGIFMPNQPEVVKYLMSRRDEVLGEVSYGENEYRPNRATKDYDVYSNQNRYLQKLSAYPDFFDDWSRESGALESFVSILTADRTQQIKTAAMDGEFLKPDWLSVLEIDAAADRLHRMCDYSPKLASRIESRIGSNWYQKVKQFRHNRDEYIKKQARFRLRGKGELRLHGAHPSKKMAAFTSLNRMNPGSHREQLANELLEFNAVFFDERPTAKKAMLVQDNSSWGSPTYSGKFDIPLKDGTRCNCAVFVGSDLVGPRPVGGSTLVLDTEGQRVALCDARQLTADLSDTHQPLDNMDFSGYPRFKASDYSEQRTKAFVVIDSLGNVTCPIKLYRSKGVLCARFCDGTELTAAYPGSSYGYEIFPTREESIYGPHSTSTYQDSIDSEKAMIHWTEPGSPLRLECLGQDSVLHVPEDSTRVELPLDDYSIPVLPVVPITSFTDEVLIKQSSFDTRRICPNVVEINSKYYSDREAVGMLMTNGVRKESALNVVRESGDRKQAYFVVDEDNKLEPWQVPMQSKIALTRLEMNRDSDFAFRDPDEQATAMSDSVIPVLEKTPNRDQITSDGMELGDYSVPPMGSERAPYPEPGVYGGDGNGQKTRSDASAQEGQEAEDLADSPESVFENMLFLSLLANNNPATDREQLLSGLLRVCDDAGRSLFMICAHGDSYAEAYGFTDAKKLEDQLMTVFEASGKLMVTLLSRSIENTHDSMLSSLMDS